MTGKTKSGIKFVIDEKIKEDARFLRYAVQMQDVNPQKSLAAMFKMFDLVFGGETGTEAFMDEVAKKNNGICSQDKLVEEFKEIIESTELKKS